VFFNKRFCLLPYLSELLGNSFEGCYYNLIFFIGCWAQQVLASIGRITIILSDALLSISLRVTVFFNISLFPRILWCCGRNIHFTFTNSMKLYGGFMVIFSLLYLHETKHNHCYIFLVRLIGLGLFMLQSCNEGCSGEFARFCLQSFSSE